MAVVRAWVRRINHSVAGPKPPLCLQKVEDIQPFLLTQCDVVDEHFSDLAGKLLGSSSVEQRIVDTFRAGSSLRARA